MQSEKISSGRLITVDAGWVSGMNTIRHPWLLRPDQYRRAVNAVNRGGVIQTRPGFKMLLILPPGNLQGFHDFKVTKQLPDGTERADDYLAIAVDGNVYVVPAPFDQPKSWESFRLINIQFDATTPYVYFCVAQKTVQTLADASLQVVPTYNVLMMQDGINQCGYFDGDTAAHLDETAPALGTPKGTWMEFSGGRLWVARGKLVIAGDAYDPLKFVERTQGQGRGDFYFLKEITGLAGFVDNNRNEILTVFTEDRTEVLQSGNRVRSTWGTTPNFQSVLFPSTGCVSGWSIIFQSGLMWWYSQGGLVSSDSAATSYLTSQVNYKDAEMAFSKQFLADDLSGVCGLSFENYLLMSMPVGQTLNSETFVLDYSPMSESSGDKIPAWSSVWTGIRPTKWIAAKIGSQRRAFCSSIDYSALSDGSHNHIWEAFQPERVDTFFELDSDFTKTEYTQQIYGEWESRLLGDGLDLKSFAYAELDFREVSGDVTLRVDYRGVRGSYKQILCKKIIAQTSYENSGIKDFESKMDTLGELRKQSRHISTLSGNDGKSNPCKGCESSNNDNVDKAFSLLVRWCGQLALESIRMFADAHPETSTAKVEQDESKVCVVDESGINHVFDRVKGFIPEEDLYQEIDSQIWIATKNYTSTLTCGSGSVTGPIVVTATATYRSQISQADADAQALAAATQAATGQSTYYRTLYPCYWDGEESSTRDCYSEPDANVAALARQASGQVIVGGIFQNDKTVPQGRIQARTEDGIRLLDFVQGTGFNDAVHVLAVDSLDRVYVGGEFTSYDGSTYNRFIRLLSDGQIDTSFIIGTGFNGSVRAIAFQSDGSILVGGLFSAYNGNSTTCSLVRLTPFGAFDGIFTADTLIGNVYDLSVLADDTVMVLGVDSGSGQYSLARYLANGGVDTGFVQYLSATLDGNGRVFAQTDTQVIISDANVGMFRFDNTGSLVDDFSYLGAGIRDFILHSNGDYYLVGSFTSPEGVTSNGIARMSLDGTVNPTFGTAIGSGLNDYGNAIVEGPNGILYIGGNFTTCNALKNVRFVRVDTAGVIQVTRQEYVAYAAARSSVSQSDANAQAQALADAKALAELPCP